MLTTTLLLDNGETRLLNSRLHDELVAMAEVVRIGRHRARAVIAPLNWRTFATLLWLATIPPQR